MQATQSIENVTLSLPIDSTSKVIKKIGCCFGKDTIMNLLFCCLTQELTLTSSKHLKN